MDRPLSWHVPGIDLAAEPPFTLGATRIDPASRDAEYPAGKERLQPQSLKVLVALARRRGAVVTRDQLVNLCWDGRVIGEDVINRSVSLLRAFAARAGGFTIETVPKAGYRLVETGAAAPLRRRRAIAAAAGVTVLLALIAFLALRPHPHEPPTPTIAILPFDQSGAGAAELAAQIRTSLSHSLSEGGFPVSVAAGAGKGDLIMSGETRRIGDQLRAVVRVELPSPRTIIYSQQWDAAASDAHRLPDRVAAQVGAALSWTAALMALDQSQSADPAITAQLLKTAALSVQGGDRLRAYEISRALAPKAPKSAIAQLGVAFNTAFALDQIPLDDRGPAVAEARRAADRAAALAPSFGDIDATWCMLHSRALFAACEDRLRTALRRDPDAPFVAYFLSALLDNVGRYDEAAQLARMSLANDRYKPAKIARLLNAQELGGQSDEAAALYREASQWWPDNGGLALNRMAGMAERGDFTAVERFNAELGATDLIPAGLTAAVRRKDIAGAKDACRPVTESSIAAILCMIGLAQAGDEDGAVQVAAILYPRIHGANPGEDDRLWLQDPSKPPFGILSAPALAPMRRDPRFLAVADRSGLLAYWRTGRLPDFCGPARAEPVCAQLRPR